MTSPKPKKLPNDFIAIDIRFLSKEVAISYAMKILKMSEQQAKFFVAVCQGEITPHTEGLIQD